MRKIVEYCTIYRHDIDEVVNQMISEWWQPYWSLGSCMDHPHIMYSQAMVKYEDDLCDNKQN